MVILFGYLVFSDFFNVLSLLGIVIIIGVGFYMIYWEWVVIRLMIFVK